MKESPGSFDLQSTDRELFELLLEEEDIARSGAGPSIIRNDVIAAPLSFSQARLWFFEQMEPGTASYNMPGGLRICGDLRIGGLEAALMEIVRRQESLRTAFSGIGGNGQQVIDPVGSISSEASRYIPRLVDLSNLAEVERIRAAERLSAEEATRPFDLSAAPLWRASLVSAGTREYTFLITMHHVISDEWSLSIFIDELARLYGRLALGEPSELDEPSVQYADYAIWQREWLRGEALDCQVEYWQQALEGAPASVELPTDRPRPAVLSYRGSVISGSFSDALSRALRAAAAGRGVTLFMLLLAAYEVLVYRYTGQEDFVIGTPVAGRDRVEVQELIGFFVNMLAMRVEPAADLTFPQVLAGLKETALGAYANQTLPFDLLVDILRPERDLSRSSIFNITFSLEQGLPESIELDGLRATPLQTNTGTAKFDLVLSIEDSPSAMKASFEYRTDLFDATTIERMMDHLEILLRAIAAGARNRISELPLLTSSEIDQVLNEWNDTDADYSADLCIHQLFERQARQVPDSVAAVFEDEQLTYRELNRDSNRLAHYLVRRGVAAGTTVGICIERSLTMVVTLLGILKSGGAYLPLDSEYPAERLEYMIADSGAAFVIADQRIVEKTRASAANFLSLENIAREVSVEADSNPEPRVTIENLIYVIYTSGSTGNPKGTALPHKGPSNCILWLQDKFQFGARDRLMMKASLSFDASVWEVFWPLVVGSTVVMVAPGGEQDSRYLLDAILRLQVTSCQFVPSLLRLFIDEPGIEKACCLQLAFSLGEALPVETMEHFLENCQAELHNFYGPTETSMGCMDWLSERDWNRSSVPIGRPISNVREHILDSQFNPVPIGVPGELYVSGKGVGFGYVGRQEQTGEKFIPDLICLQPGDRMYRTGDLCRYLPDGNIEFLGRIDHQVKIRGFRIELGEVESALAQHPSVSECLVIARGDLGPDKRLVGYFVPANGAQVSPTILRSFAREKLPSFMVPAYFVELQELPLSQNGKVDRRALPRPDSGDIAPDEYHAPIGATEELLANLWAEILGLERVSRDANFFDLGGHSLLATQVVSRIRDSFRIEIPLRRLFEYPALSALARAIQSTLAGDGAEIAPPIVKVEHGQFVPLSHAQERLWFLDQLEPDRAVYNSIAGLRLRGPLSISALDQALAEIVRRHESLRTTFEMRDGEPVQFVHPDRVTQVPVIEVGRSVEGDSEANIMALARDEGTRIFDLQQGPLFRTSLFRSGPVDHYLVAYMHHIVTDGWSMGVFTREVATLYNSFSTGAESELDELAIQYSDFATWHRRYIRSSALADQLEYWRSRLSDAAPILDFPFDRQRPAVQTYEGATLYFELADSFRDGLHSVAKREAATLFMVLLAAFQTLLHRYSGQDDISIGSPISNRTRKEIEPLIGFFANTLVLRSQLEEGKSFRDLLKAVREATLEAYAHQDLPFEMLVEALQPVRDLSHLPLFQFLFVFQNAPQSEVVLSGLEVDPLSLDAGKAHFEMTLGMMEENGSVQAVIEYNTDLFDESTISRFFGHFQVLLGAITDDAGLRISDLPLLTESERIQLIRDFNSTAREFEEDRGVHELFERQTVSTPDAISLIFDGSHVTYDCLDQSAQSLALTLRSAGVTTDVLAGVCVDRSLEMVTAVIAVLKAGGGYVPLDASYPADRLGWMMEGINVLLTEQIHANRLPPTKAPLFFLDSRDFAHPEVPRIPISDRKSEPESLAYVVYTSGSTGRPKGVAMSHQAAVKMICWQLSSSSQGQGGRTLQFASLSFDVSFQEMFSTLGSGGTLVLVSDESRKDPSRLLDTIVSENVERIFVPVVALQQMAEASAEQRRIPSSLREIITAGEQLRITDHVASLFQELRSCRLFNHYGPSETHAATAYNLPFDYKLWPHFPPIGEAIDNTTLYLLDREMKPNPLGVIGEVFIGGRGLARGYLNQPEMTAERFIPDLFSDLPGSRLYAAGDRGRFRPGGTVEFLGRADHQVKVRGYRVEPAEIEIAIRRYPLVKQAVVIAREYGSGEKRLIGYFVPREGSEPDVSDLKTLLKQTLPEYMVPAALVCLDKLPMTGSGKIDRLSLPDPEELAAEPADSSKPFHNFIEEVVAEVFGQVLGVERVAADQNFFDLGGNSLTATRAVARLRAAFNIELPLRKMFESSSVSELAACIEEELKGGKTSRPPAIPRCDRGSKIPLSFAQRRIWFLAGLAPDSAAYNISGAFRISGPLDADLLEWAINRIIARHEVLRTSFAEVDGRPVQVIHPEVRFDLQKRSTSASKQGENLKVALEMAAQVSLTVFDLTRPPLLSGLLIQLGESEHLLALSMHHIVSDGASIDVFFRELCAFYQASETESAQLPDLKIQYADYAVWQRQWLQAEALEQEISYWKRTLGDAGHPIQLPLDRPRPLTQTFNGSTIEFEISAETARSARKLRRREGTTLFMTLLAAFHALLNKYSGQDDLCVGLPVTNRGLPETEDLIGFFVNTIVIRARIDQAESFAALLRQIRERSVEAYTHQDVPFEKLVDELQPVRDLSRSPIFQVAFALSPPSQIPYRLGALEVEQIEIESRTAKFDLFLALEDQSDGVKAVIEYNTDLFDADTVERIGNHFAILTSALVSRPDDALREASVMTDAELEQIVYKWNETGAPGYDGAVFPELFEGVAELLADAPAVIQRDLVLTYGALNALANRLSRRLIDSGLDSEHTVGICLRRRLEMIVAIIAAFKAGIPYLPLDPANPLDRIKSILDDSRASLVIGEPNIAETVAASEIQFWPVDKLSQQIQNYSPENLDSEPFPETVAYLIYTSGSTGRPKGVAVEHRNLTNYLAGIITRLSPCTGTSFAALSTASADLGYTAIFPALVTGGRLDIVPEEFFLDGEALADYLESHPIDVLKIVPSHLAALQSAAKPRDIMPRTMLVVGGEASDAGWVKSLARSFPGVSILNHYGPTETTVGVSTFPIKEDLPATQSRTAPIGRPLAGSRLYILSNDLSPVPIGANGGMYIGGNGVSRGYAGNTDATSEKFLPDPFSRKPGARIYASGDVCRYLSDGAIEFLGRSDDQVKVRGFRVEPREIERALLAHPDVSKAVVVARHAKTQQRSLELAAYVVPRRARAHSLNGHARYTLPNNMAVAHINKNETDYIYKEVFELQAYSRFGTSIEPESVVFDVGANIGLFTLFAAQLCSSARIFSFEPNPRAFEILKINANLYAPGAQLFNYGLSDREGTASFTFFPGFTLFSGLHSDAETEKQVVRRFIANQASSAGVELSEVLESADEILDRRFESENFPVSLRRLSDVIEENKVERIDLLKINVEKSELDVLRGIADAHWNRINQIVLEVDLRDNLSSITSLLESHGYLLNVFQDEALAGTDLYYVYARRHFLADMQNGQESDLSAFAAPVLPNPFLTAAELKVFLEERVPEHMVPRAISLIERIPLTRNGKLDRTALPETDAPSEHEEFVAPGNSIERAIATAWRETLGVERVGVNDNFFGLGGNSLLLAQVCAKLRKTVSPAISVIELFKYPTVRALTHHLSQDSPTAASYDTAERRGLDRRKAVRLRSNRAGASDGV